MTVIDSLPDRPLDEGEVAGLNRSDEIDLAVAVEPDENAADAPEGPTEALLLATDRWVKGLARGAEGWTVVETASLDDAERYEALRACEDAVRGFRPDGASE